MAHVKTKRPLLSAIFLGAGGFVVLDIAALAVIAALGRVLSSPMQSALDVWSWFHWPAFSVAGLVLHRPQDMHDSVPLGFLAGLGALFLVQVAVVGGVLGGVLFLVRRRRHAL